MEQILVTNVRTIKHTKPPNRGSHTLGKCMKVAFGLHLDGLKPATPETASGRVTLGPRGLLGVLETQLGLPTPDTHPSEAPFSYLQCLREASTPDSFFYRSLEIDPVNVARTLLAWREQWYEAGWDGTFPEDAPGRLADMAAVEAIARNRVPLTQGERLQRVAEALAQRRYPDRTGGTSHAFRRPLTHLAARRRRVALGTCRGYRVGACRGYRAGACCGYRAGARRSARFGPGPRAGKTALDDRSRQRSGRSSRVP